MVAAEVAEGAKMSSKPISSCIWLPVVILDKNITEHHVEGVEFTSKVGFKVIIAREEVEGMI